MTAAHTLTLSGSAADSVTGLKGTLDATGLTGALTAAFAGATQSATLGSANATLTDSATSLTIDATHMAAGSLLTLSGAGSATVQALKGALAAGGLTGTLTRRLSGPPNRTLPWERAMRRSPTAPPAPPSMRRR